MSDSCWSTNHSSLYNKYSISAEKKMKLYMKLLILADLISLTL